MKVDVTCILKTIDGKDLKDSDAKGELTTATLKTALVNAVLSPAKSGEDGIAKVKKYELAKKIYDAEDEVDLTIEDIALIKKQVGEIFAPLVVGQVFELLNI